MEKYLDNDIIIGAVQSTMWRAVPKKEINDRVSGYHRNYTGGVPPVPYIWNRNEKSQNEAIGKAVSNVADWLNNNSNLNRAIHLSLYPVKE